jgi:hypothetical protein
MCGRDQKRMVEVKNACWEGLVTWWAVEGLEHAVGGGQSGHGHGHWMRCGVAGGRKHSQYLKKH